MGEWLLSRRDSAIVAWHEVPGNGHPKKEASRRVRSDSCSVRTSIRGLQYWNDEVPDGKTEEICVFGKGFIRSKSSSKISAEGAFRRGRSPGEQRPIIPYPTGRCFRGKPLPRHFVPGFDHTVPLGRSTFSARGKPRVKFSRPVGPKNQLYSHPRSRKFPTRPEDMKVSEPRGRYFLEIFPIKSSTAKTGAEQAWSVHRKAAAFSSVGYPTSGLGKAPSRSSNHSVRL
jgi:hypothetical protein